MGDLCPMNLISHELVQTCSILRLFPRFSGNSFGEVVPGVLLCIKINFTVRVRLG